MNGAVYEKVQLQRIPGTQEQPIPPKKARWIRRDGLQYRMGRGPRTGPRNPNLWSRSARRVCQLGTRLMHGLLLTRSRHGLAGTVENRHNDASQWTR